MIAPSGHVIPTGSIVGSDYEIVGLIDAGTKHHVYDVWSIHRRSRCVLKTLASGEPVDVVAARHLVQEGKLLRRLTHRHLVRAYEVIEEPRPMVVLETLTGESVSHAIDRLGRLPLGDVSILGLQLCSVTSYLHDRGWLHLDLKPSNIVAATGSATLIDLGLARHPGRTHAGVGTRGYLSPEQSRGGLLGAPADVWGIGAVMYEAATGGLPYDDQDEATPSAGGSRSSGSEHGAIDPIDEPPPPIRTRRRVPRAFGTIVDDCLSLEPEARPSLDAVSKALSDLTGIDPKRVGTPTSEPASRGR